MEDGKIIVDIYYNDNYVAVDYYKSRSNNIHIISNIIDDTDWKILPYTYKGAELKSEIKKPLFLEEMLEYSKILAEGFSYVRIDFHRLPKKTVALEMTFTPYSAMIPFSNKAFDIELGKLIKLPVPSV